MALYHTNVLDPQIKALPTVSTASGSVATFDTDMTENLVEVVCDIVYSQASGTPSPSNPRPITTYTSLNLGQDGKYVGFINFNQLYPTQSVTFSGSTFTITSSNDGKFVIDCTSATNGTTGNATAIGASAFTANHIYAWLGKNGTITANLKAYTKATDTIFKVTSASYNNVSFTFNNTPVGTYDIYLQLFDLTQMFGDTVANEILTMEQSESGTGVAYVRERLYKNYYAYNSGTIETLGTANNDGTGNTYNIPFGQTVANGVLDVTTGKLRVTWGVCNLADLAWIQNTYNPSIFNGTLPSRCKSANILSFKSSEYVSTDSTTALTLDNCVAISSARTVVYCHDERYTNVTDFKNGVTALLIYELDTPYDIQLSSTQITALLNENNIWCDTGDTEVKFLLTVGKKIG